MHEAGHIVAIPPGREQIDAIVADLALAGLHAEIVQARPGVYELEDESLHEHVQTGEHGLFLGLATGALVGLVIVLVVGAFMDLDLLAQLLLVGGIALQGTIPAIMWRMGRADRYDDDPEMTRVLTEDDPLVVVDALHDEHHAREVLGRHGVVFLTSEQPLSLAA